jgi:hypothetical protein
MEHGRVTFNEDEDWREAFDQISMFPTSGVHDDLVDALSYVDQLCMTSYNADYEDEGQEVFDVISGW